MRRLRYTSVGVPLPFFFFVIASQRVRPEVTGPMTSSAKQSSAAVSLCRTTKLARIAPLDCFVASLLAMTRQNSGADRVAGTMSLIRPREAGEDQEHQDSVMLHRTTLYVSKRAIFVGRARSLLQRRRISKSRFVPKGLNKDLHKGLRRRFPPVAGLAEKLQRNPKPRHAI